MTVVRVYCYDCKCYQNVTVVSDGFICPRCERMIGCVMVPYSEGGPK